MTTETQFDLLNSTSTANTNSSPIDVGLTPNTLLDEAQWSVAASPGGNSNFSAYDSSNLVIPTPFTQTGLDAFFEDPSRSIGTRGDLQFGDTANPLNNLEVAAQTGDSEAPARNTSSSSGGSFNCPNENQVCTIDYNPPDFAVTPTQETERQSREEREQQRLEDQRAYQEAQQEAVDNTNESSANQVRRCLPRERGGRFGAAERDGGLIPFTGANRVGAVVNLTGPQLIREAQERNTLATQEREALNALGDDALPSQIERVELLEEQAARANTALQTRIQRARTRVQSGDISVNQSIQNLSELESECNEIWENAATVGGF